MNILRSQMNGKERGKNGKTSVWYNGNSAPKKQKDMMDTNLKNMAV